MKKQNTPNLRDTCACCALGGLLGDLRTSLNRCGAPGRPKVAKESPQRATCTRVQRIWSILLLQGATLDHRSSRAGDRTATGESCRRPVDVSPTSMGRRTPGFLPRSLVFSLHLRSEVRHPLLGAPHRFNDVQRAPRNPPIAILWTRVPTCTRVQRILSILLLQEGSKVAP